MTRARQTVAVVPVEDLTAHPANIRKGLGDLTELARSIKEHGILQPLTVTEHPDGGYLIIAGHRRLAAAIRAGAHRLPVTIRHQVEDPDEQLVLMIVENVQRQNLSPIEKAEAYGTLRQRGLSISDISRRTGVHVSTISTHLALLELDENSRERVRNGELNAGTAIAAVREHRQLTRVADERPARGRPVVIDPPHFTQDHPLFPQAAAICDHTTRPKVAGCCGQCWETVIRIDAGGGSMPEPAYDEVIVDRIYGGSYNVAASLPDRIEVVRRWRAAGRSLNDLARLTGWKVDRYYRPERRSA